MAGGEEVEAALHVVDLTLSLVALAALLVLLSPRVRDNAFWRATVTPLASIIGSGFLILAPLLGDSVGRLAPAAMLAIVVLAHLIGAVMRFNIRHAEPLLERGGGATPAQRLVEHVANLGLFAAYVVSVAFYLRLMSSFVLKGLGQLSEVNARTLTTVVLLFIAVAGWRRGLRGLERLEEYSVSVKLAIIAGLLLGLAIYAVTDGAHNGPAVPGHPPADVLRMLAGMLLVVQGFETSRYLGAEHPAEVRIRSMRMAQWIAAIIYVGFALLIVPLIPELPPGRPDETAIIGLSGIVAPVLPLMLIVAAAMSQFSAAIADTLGGGGVIAEKGRGRIGTGHGYVLIAALAIVLVWSADIFEIVAYASRAFAFYYLAQTVLATMVCWRLPDGAGKGARLLGFGLLAAVLAWVTLFAVPVG